MSSDYDYQVLQYITREDVITQLKILGYHDVPDETIDEFLRELQKKSLEKLGKSQPKEESISEKEEEDKEEEEEKEEENEEEDEEENEEEDTETKSSKDFSGEEEEIKPSSKERIISDKKDDDKSPVFESRTSFEKPKGGRDINAPPVYISGYDTDDEHTDLNKIEYVHSDEDRHEKFSNKENTHSKSGRSSVRSSISSLRTPLSPITYRPPRKLPINTYRKKIHDPVKRFQQLQRIWSKDKYLQNNKDQHKALRWQVRKEMLAISGDFFATRRYEM